MKVSSIRKKDLNDEYIIRNYYISLIFERYLEN